VIHNRADRNEHKYRDGNNRKYGVIIGTECLQVKKDDYPDSVFSNRILQESVQENKKEGIPMGTENVEVHDLSEPVGTKCIDTPADKRGDDPHSQVPDQQVNSQR
jgi:hypothetical protein